MLRRLLKIVVYRCKYNKRNVVIGTKSNLQGLNTTFEGNNRIGKNVKFGGSIGRCSYIGDNCEITADIGRYCSIASNVRTIAGKHPTRNWVSTSPVFFSTLAQCGTTYVSDNKFSEDSKRIKIGSDVWIGNGALLLEGIEIGHGSIVAAGAVVVRDVEPYSVVGGVPAKVIRKRFSDDEIEKLLHIQWWNMDEAWLKNNTDYFSNIQSFINFTDVINK